MTGTRDSELLRRLCSMGLLQEQEAARLLSRARPGELQSLLQQLQVRGRLSPDQLRELESLSAQRPADFMTEALAPGRAGQGASQRVALSPERRGALDWLRAELGRDPLFAPHAEVLLEARDVLGEGGMGRVRRVYDRRLDREAALKTLLDPKADAQAIARLLREARLTARLDHPGVPPIFEAGVTSQGEHFLLMRVIGGEDLSAAIARYHESGRPRRLLRELIEVLLRASEAIAYAHSRGLVHRDLKPDNIRIGEFGEVLVMDWGIALDRRSQSQDTTPEPWDPTKIDPQEQASRLTQAGSVLGTPGYMAPEQASAGRCDGRADVFALGAILTELLTNQTPIRGETTLIRIVATLEGRISSPRELDRGVNRELDALARRALEPDLQARLPSAALLAAELRAWLSGEPLSSYRYSLSERALGWARRHPALILALAAGSLLLALAGVLGASLYQARAERDSAQRAEAKIRAVLEAMAEAETLAASGYGGDRLGRAFDKAFAAGGRSRGLLLRTARLRRELGEASEARALLEEIASRFPPAYEALLELHELESAESQGASDRGFLMTSAMRRVLALAKNDPEDSEFKLLSLALPKIEPNQANEEALALLDRAIAMNPRQPFPYQARSVVRLQRKELELALKDANTALDLDPAALLPAMMRWTVFSQLDQPEKALAEVQRTLRFCPKVALVWRTRAQIYESLDQRELALEDARKAIALDPKDDYNWAALGRILRALGRKDEAEAAWIEALTRNPANARALAARASSALERGAWREAEDLATRSLELDPGSIEALEARARSREKQGQLAEALEDWRSAQDREPRRATAFVEASRLLGLLKAPSEGVFEELNKGIQGVQKPEILLLARASLELARGDSAAALRSYEEALRSDPQCLQALKERGELFLGSQRYPEALRDFEAMVRLAPKSGLWRSYVAMTLLLMGRYRESLEAAEQALALGENPAALQAKAQALENLDQPGEALRTWERLVATCPQLPNPSLVQSSMARLRARLKER